MSFEIQITIFLLMAIHQNITAIWHPVIKHASKVSPFRSVTRLTKKLSFSIWFSLLFIIKFFYYAMTKPEKLTLSMSKTAEKFSEMKIPKFMRKKFFKTYSRYYGVKLEEIVEPLDHFATFSSFFTRKVKSRRIDGNPHLLISPADSKILKISDIHQDKCSIIKGASYSLKELLTGIPEKYSPEQINGLKKNPNNKLYQVILYLAPGDYHRFHSPTDYLIQERKKISGVLLSVSEKTLIKRKKVYEKNGRVVLHGSYEVNGEELYLGMVMVGALNVGRIMVHENKDFKKGEEVGYFNLGSTIVLVFESKEIKSWEKMEGDKIRFGEPICEFAKND